MSRFRSTIATAAAVTLTVAQLLCLCGPAGATLSTEKAVSTSVQTSAAAHDMAGHHDMSGDLNRATDAHSHNSVDCFHCSGTASAAAPHVDVYTADGTGFKYPALLLTGSGPSLQNPTPVAAKFEWPPPDVVLRAPETLVSLKTLLLI